MGQLGVHTPMHSWAPTTAAPLSSKPFGFSAVSCELLSPNLLASESQVSFAFAVYTAPLHSCGAPLTRTVQQVRWWPKLHITATCRTPAGRHSGDGTGGGLQIEASICTVLIIQRRVCTFGDGGAARQAEPPCGKEQSAEDS